MPEEQRVLGALVEHLQKNSRVQASEQKRLAASGVLRIADYTQDLLTSLLSRGAL